ncbi:hypothetical protein WDV06_02965 [Streptomyces racemochromogenes]|uniref:LRV domain-containing protein n=1 Tax=Streptomyces racemochromogenes TaxID=67353 RepID=A0ABW7P6U2_9ACTN
MDHDIPLPELLHLPYALYGLARNPAVRADPQLCDALRPGGPARRLAAAQALPEEIAARLAADPDPEVRAERAGREGAAGGRHGLFAADPEAEVRIALAQNPGLSPELAARLGADTDPAVREAVARREEAPAEDLHRALLADPEAKVRVAACRHRPPAGLHGALLADPATRHHVVPFLDLDPETAERLAADPDDRVREQLAGHPCLSAELRAVLARDADPGVRGKVFERADATPQERAAIFASLTAGALRYEEDPRDSSDEDFLCDAMLAYLDLMPYPWVEPDPLPYADSPYAGLRCAAARSTALPAEARARLLADDNPRVRFLALAGLAEPDPALVEELDRRQGGRVKHGGRPADLATFPPETLRRFAADPDAWMRLLALRDPDLPPDLLERLAADGDEGVRQATAEHPRIPVEALVRLLGDTDEDVVEAAAASPALPVEVMRALLDRADAAGGPPPRPAACEGDCRHGASER